MGGNWGGAMVGGGRPGSSKSKVVEKSTRLIDCSLAVSPKSLDWSSCKLSLLVVAGKPNGSEEISALAKSAKQEVLACV